MKISVHYFWSNVKQKSKVIKNTLKMGPLKIQDFWYPEYDLYISQNLITSCLWTCHNQIKKHSERSVYYFWGYREHRLRTDRQKNAGKT